jgi:hypothetical protein
MASNENVKMTTNGEKEKILKEAIDRGFFQGIVP